MTIYTDGSCLGNPGVGGWAALLLYGDHKKELTGSAPETTNNRMELLGPIEALKALKESVSVEIYTDSQYVKDGMTKWLSGWQQNNWKTSNKKDVKNKDLWEALLAETKRHHVAWFWVRGHDESEHNNLVDKLARQAAEDLKKTLSKTLPT